MLPNVALDFPSFSKPMEADFEAANARIQPLAKVKLAPPAAATGAAPGSRSGEELYKAVCGACHETGVAGSPKTGDKAAWAPRIGVGLATLTKIAITGKGRCPRRAALMPPMRNWPGPSFSWPISRGPISRLPD